MRSTVNAVPWGLMKFRLGLHVSSHSKKAPWEHGLPTTPSGFASSAQSEYKVPMPIVQLRAVVGQSNPNDLEVEVQDNTIQYLLNLPSAKNARVSSYLDRDWPLVQASYGELVIDGCKYENIVTRVIPGSRTRVGIKLPGPMHKGEQLTLEVELRAKTTTVAE
jgi:hypothetical protein